MCDKQELFLIAITLPQAAELALYRFRTQLFRETGRASALAFKPLIPLGWSRERPIDDEVPFLELSDELRQMKTGIAAVSAGDSWFLPVSTGALEETCERWRAAASRARGNTEPSVFTDGWFTVYPGIFLCRRDEGPAAVPFGMAGNDAAAEKPAEEFTLPASLKINDLRMICLRLRTGEPDRWWLDLETTELWSKHLR